MSILNPQNITVPDLLVRSGLVTSFTGDQIGSCIICLSSTNEGVISKEVLSNNFTNFSALVHGHIICPNCAGALKTKEVRYGNWVVTENTFYTPKHQNMLNTLRSIVEGPERTLFAIYVTQTFKKHGWLTHPCSINYSGPEQPLTILWEEELVQFNNFGELVTLYDTIEQFLRVVPRTRLTTFTPSVSEVEKLAQSGLYSSFLNIKQDYNNSPVIDFLLSVIPTPKRDKGESKAVVGDRLMKLNDLFPDSDLSWVDKDKEEIYWLVAQILGQIYFQTNWQRIHGQFSTEVFAYQLTKSMNKTTVPALVTKLCSLLKIGSLSLEPEIILQAEERKNMFLTIIRRETQLCVLLAQKYAKHLKSIIEKEGKLWKQLK